MLIEENIGTKVTLDGQPYTYFGGTNYLGMAHRAELIEAGNRAFRKYGFSSSASRLTSGENLLLLELENFLRDFANFESSVVLPAGFLSNLAVVDAIGEFVEGWLIQPFAHSSIRSAIATSSKPIYTIGQDEAPAGSNLGIFLEPINPLTGELTDVPAIASSASANSYIVLDEAHSFGVLGTNGGGAAEHFSLDKANVISTGTFSKAIGAYGGFVLATQDVIARIKEKSGSYRGSTPLSPVVCAAALASLRVISSDRISTLEALRENIDVVNARLQKSGMNKTTRIPIFYMLNPIDLPALEDKLRAEKIYVPVVGSYFKAACDLAFRWTIHATHTASEIERFLGLVASHIRV